MQTLDYSKKLPLYGEFDVIVLGGGPAGVCAAIEAARDGADVLLCERTGMLGGSAAAALVGPFMTCYDRDGNEKVVGGLFDEIVDGMKKLGGAIDPADCDSPSVYTSFIGKYHRHVTPFDSFVLQLVLDRMCAEAGVHTLLYTAFADSVTEDGGISFIVLDAPQGLIAASAEVYIDATGNADVAAASGVATWKGGENGENPQPGTLFFEVDGAEDEKYIDRPERPVKCYRKPLPGSYKVNHLRVYGIDRADADSMTKGHIEAREQVLDSYAVLRRTPGFEHSRITQVAPELGIREGRHIEGLYRLTVEDLSEGREFPDTILRFGYGMDVHPRTDEGRNAGGFSGEVADVYYVPYRCLVPKGCSNLLVAGKTVSAESQAAGSIRVMPACMAMGQAAGAAAAICTKKKISPADVDAGELRSVLAEHGAMI